MATGETNVVVLSPPDDADRAALVTAATPDGAAEPLSLEAQIQRLQRYTGSKTRPEARAAQFLASFPQMKREMEEAGVAAKFNKRQARAPTIVEQRPPFDHLHICRRGDEICGVFTKVHLEQLLSFGFIHERDVTYYGADAQLPYAAPPLRRTPLLRLETDDVSAEEPETPRLPEQMPQYKTKNDVIKTMEQPFRVGGEVYSSLIKWGDDSSTRRKRWQDSCRLEKGPIASNETQYKQRLQMYWAFHRVDKWVAHPGDDELPTPRSTLYKEAADAKKEQEPAVTWMAAVKEIFSSKSSQLALTNTDP